MKLRFLVPLVSLLVIGNHPFLANIEAAETAVRHPDPSNSYTITSRLELVAPFRFEDMSDDFQEARMIAHNASSCIVDVTYFPFFIPPLDENPGWKQDDATMTEYLRATPTENWDDSMRRVLITELRAAGINPDVLTDRQLVQRVAPWAMRRARTTSAFAIWTIYFPNERPKVYPDLRWAFEQQRRDPSLTDDQMIGEEALGRTMFYEKIHGSCTSSSIYLATILRALGIPTRIVFCIPPFDPNDDAQSKLFYGTIHNTAVREAVKTALSGSAGFLNHVFNEVYVGHHWVRLNYTRLGQPILDPHYLGLFTHILTSADMSRVPLAQTWGRRFFSYPAGQSRLSSVNPYRLISITEHVGGTSSAISIPITSPNN